MSFEYKPQSDFPTKAKWVSYLFTLGAGKGVTERLIDSRLNRSAGWSIERCVTEDDNKTPKNTHYFKRSYQINYR